MAVGPRKRHTNHSLANNEPMHHGKRQIRHEAIPWCVPENQPSIQPATIRPVCLQSDSPATLILPLETRPNGRVSGYLPTRPEQSEGLQQSPTRWGHKKHRWSWQLQFRSLVPNGSGYADGNPYSLFLQEGFWLLLRGQKHKMMDITPQLAVWAVPEKLPKWLAFNKGFPVYIIIHLKDKVFTVLWIIVQKVGYLVFWKRP